MFRKMRRFKQQLTDDACAEVLKNGQRGILAVLGDEGYPYTVPLDYVYTDGGGAQGRRGARRTKGILLRAGTA